MTIDTREHSQRGAHSTPRRARPILILAVVLVAALSINVETTIVNVALPTLNSALGASTRGLQWIVDAYNLAFAALVLAGGTVGDKFGRRGTLMAGLGLLAASSVGAALCTSTGSLIAMRLVMGIAAALIYPTTLAIITDTFRDSKQRAAAIGVWGAVTGLGVAIGPILGGALLESFWWGSLFLALVPIALVAAVGAALFVPASDTAPGARLDRGGLLLSVVMLGALVYTIIEAPDRGWTATRTLTGFGVALIAMVAFVWWERRHDDPLIDVSLFANLRFSAASGAVTVSFFTLFGFIFLMTQYFQFLRHYSPLSTGVHLLPVATAVAIGSVAGTQAAVRAGTKAVVAGGLLLIAAFYFWVAATTSTTLSYGIISVQMVVYGLGLGFTSAPATESIMGAIAARAAGVGSAVNDTTRLVGGTLGVAVIGSVYASLYQHRMGGLLAAGVPSRLVQTSRLSVGAGLAVAQHLTAGGQAALGQIVNVTTTNAFLHGLRVACVVAAVVALAGTIAAAALLPSRPPAPAVPDLTVPANDRPSRATERTAR